METSQNIGYFQNDDNLKSSRDAWFQANYIDEGFRIIDEAPSKTPKIFRDGHVQILSLIEPRTGLGLRNLEACFVK
jgi:hypothetical protein